MAEIRVTDVVQVCVVVHDLDASVRTYHHEFGIGPWAIYTFGPRTVDDLRQDGEPVDTSWRLAIAQVGSMMWELIQPLDDRSTYARFLAEHGEGVHHVAVGLQSFDDAVAARTVELSGTYEGVSFAYLKTADELGVTLEIFDRIPEGQPPEETYP
jgi:glyoxalase/bleomycin resistance protein/dioxygenase superfamily protein